MMRAIMFAASIECAFSLFVAWIDANNGDLAGFLLCGAGAVFGGLAWAGALKLVEMRQRIEGLKEATDGMRRAYGPGGGW